MKECEGLLGGNELILVADDHAMSLEYMESVLGLCGYSVLLAPSPRKAVQIARKHANEIDMLITDVFMPGMNGRDLAEGLLADYPGMKCLYTSAFSNGTTMTLPDTHFIQKPFSAIDLTTKVREVLDH